MRGWLFDEHGREYLLERHMLLPVSEPTEKGMTQDGIADFVVRRSTPATSLKQQSSVIADRPRHITSSRKKSPRARYAPSRGTPARGPYSIKLLRRSDHGCHVTPGWPMCQEHNPPASSSPLPWPAPRPSPSASPLPTPTPTPPPMPWPSAWNSSSIFARRALASSARRVR